MPAQSPETAPLLAARQDPCPKRIIDVFPARGRFYGNRKFLIRINYITLPQFYETAFFKRSDNK